MTEWIETADFLCMTRRGMHGTLHRANEIMQRVPLVAIGARLSAVEFLLVNGVLETKGRIPCG